MTDRVSRRFVKMHGLGNDFVILDATGDPIRLEPSDARVIADRRTGVGCDQVLVLEAPRRPGTTAYYRVFNNDGSEAEQCGNGARCLGRYWAEMHPGVNRFELECKAGRVGVRVESADRIAVSMGVPVIGREQPGARASIRFENTDYPFIAVLTGNPHAVIRVDDVDLAPVEGVGSTLQDDPRFPHGVNVEFMQVMAPGHIRLRVFERGAGETLACGTGACAAAAAGMHAGYLENPVSIDLPGGHLVVSWVAFGEPIWLAGPAAKVFEGTIDI